jgi:asparagine synthase (glutamine-hydrolysing)
MCGIVGFVQGTARLANAADALRAATDTLVHRGPDDRGCWISSDHRVALGHRRLAVVDLSQDGHQPMTSASGRFTIVFNGEIYNYRSLRRDLEALGHRFHGHSDTAVMLAAFEQWDLQAALRRFDGMFAFALWDSTRRTVSLARDRLGEKPLYVGKVGEALAFGSELKALRRLPGFSGTIDRDALAAFLRFNYIPAPLSIYQGIRKLSPGHSLTISLKDGELYVGPEEAFWSAAESYSGGRADDTVEQVDRLEALLKDAVGLRMVADVPLGAFLSGGIDSSTVVALMQAQSSERIRTFSIGFEQEQYNEAPYARAVAEHLGTDHTELCVTAADTLAVMPKLPHIYDEPFADSSQIPTYLVSALARKHVTVSLSGDGGDELFGGYARYALANRMERRWSAAPRWARSMLGSMLAAPNASTLNKLAAPLSLLLPRGHWLRAPGDRVRRLGEMLRAADTHELYRLLVSQWTKPADVVIGASERADSFSRRAPEGVDFDEWMTLIDLITYLPDDILAKLDRASMAVALEGRVPLLDHRVVEFAARLPWSLKVRDGKTKWILRQVLYRHVPPSLIERPKQGFAVPIEHWLRGPLRAWAESHLSEERLRADGFFRPERICRYWEEHRDGKRDWHFQLWGILTFQSWFAEQAAHG